MKMTVREASEWVHVQTIANETALDELAAAFAALTGQKPRADDRPDGLFRRCAEIVMSGAGDVVGRGPRGRRP